MSLGPEQSLDQRRRCIDSCPAVAMVGRVVLVPNAGESR